MWYVLVPVTTNFALPLTMRRWPPCSRLPIQKEARPHGSGVRAREWISTSYLRQSLISPSLLWSSIQGEQRGEKDLCPRTKKLTSIRVASNKFPAWTTRNPIEQFKEWTQRTEERTGGGDREEGSTRGNGVPQPLVAPGMSLMERPGFSNGTP